MGYVCVSIPLPVSGLMPLYLNTVSGRLAVRDIRVSGTRVLPIDFPLMLYPSCTFWMRENDPSSTKKSLIFRFHTFRSPAEEGYSLLVPSPCQRFLARSASMLASEVQLYSPRLRFRI